MSTILRLPGVMDRTGLARSSIYFKIREGTFPRPVSLGQRAVGWLASDIENWIENRVAASRATCQLMNRDGSAPRGGLQ